MTNQTTASGARLQLNLAGLSKNDYKGAPSTLCQGCGHNSIANQIIAAAYEMDLVPENVVKFSGIGCSSKSPTYFLNRSFGFNGLHGRMPSLATGALFADHTVRGLAVSGDGDTASIGMGQFKHVVRRNVPMVYIVENNGVYGLTKGQFSATAERGLQLKKQGTNPYLPIDIAWEALVANASFVARSFAGDAKQVRELVKIAMRHRGLAVLDIISPCVTFNNEDSALHSYAWGKDHEVALHDLAFVPRAEEIMVDYEEGEAREVMMHDGSQIILKKLERDYNPTDRSHAMQILEESNRNQVLLTGLIYINEEPLNLLEKYDLPEEALNRLSNDRLRPDRSAIDRINALMF